MSDEKLRDLERRFRETGSADDELAWLRERARSGEKLDWDSYSRLHELDVEAADDYLRWRVETDDWPRRYHDLANEAGLLRSTPEQIPRLHEAAAIWGLGCAFALIPIAPDPHRAEATVGVEACATHFHDGDLGGLESDLQGSCLNLADLAPALEALNAAIGPLWDLLTGSEEDPPYLDPMEVFGVAEIRPSDFPRFLRVTQQQALRVLFDFSCNE